jgi:diguanylate cyclase (GGDEF)-like protein
MKILLADDERLARTMLERWLRSWGYDVVAVSNGRHALEALEQDPELQLAILDWVMPDLDGLEACRALRSRESEPYVYLILLTARDDKEHIIAGLDAGADDYIIKPCNPLELKVRLRAGSRVVELQRELIRAREALRFEALHDPLTGLMNRRALMQQLAREVARSDRSGKPLSVLMSDVDHFKSINDTHGHFAGDFVLKEVAQRMLHSVRPYDGVGRYGGEEFIVILPECDSRTAMIIAERLRRAICREPILADGKQILLTLSTGVAGSDQHPGARGEDLIRCSDTALYRAKRAGRNRTVLATSADWQSVHSQGAPISSGIGDPTGAPALPARTAS